MALTLIAGYDISEDRRRARLAALCQTWGDRVQRSVFLLTIADDELDTLRQRALDIIDPKTDSFYLFRQCINCWGSLGHLGQAHPATQEFYWAAL